MILTGDCLEVMPTLDAESIDAIVTDPPYDLTARKKGGSGVASVNLDSPYGRARIGTGNGAGGFMGKAWDGTGVAFRPETWAAALRVANPGAYLVAAGGTRTVHRLASAIEDAGWEIRDMLIWAYASGFPKSLNVSAALRKLPACSCDVAGEIGAVEPGPPAGAIRAGIGAEAGAVPLAGLPTDHTGGIWPQASAGANGRRRKVEAGNVTLGGEFDPVVLGSPGMATDTKSHEISGIVGAVQIQPETLRDEVVSEQLLGGPAVQASTLDGNGRPTAALIPPASATPRRIVAAREPSDVISRHASTGAVNPLGHLTGDNLAAGATSEDVGHPPNDTTEGRALRCSECGGVKQDPIIEGMGTALKPSFEPWVLARKPLRGNVAANVLAHGTGALNIDLCRIGWGADTPTQEEWNRAGSSGKPGANGYAGQFSKGMKDAYAEGKIPVPLGRWPSNLILTDPIFDGGWEGVVGGGQTGPAGTAVNRNRDPDTMTSWMGTRASQTGEDVTYGDSGTYSRFFIIPKAARADREPVMGGLAEREREARYGSVQDARPHTPEGYVYGRKPRANLHPTVKPVDLMRHLVRLVTPPRGLVLDPFLGSGSTAVACEMEGFRWVGIEKEAEYVAIAEARLFGIRRGLGLGA